MLPIRLTSVISKTNILEFLWQVLENTSFTVSPADAALVQPFPDNYHRLLSGFLLQVNRSMY